ncbi:hypothetical protein R1sor_008976 [Riccia sorocarpa]|uniref:Uncharacterized protein n=1 Tax=Riccia sorocarpa TaxID=122646 RepID=A0ABD3H4G1_9MARC
MSHVARLLENKARRRGGGVRSRGRGRCSDSAQGNKYHCTCSVVTKDGPSAVGIKQQALLYITASVSSAAEGKRIHSDWCTNMKPHSKLDAINSQ